MQPVELTVVSPETALPGLDHAIEQLQALDRLHSSLFQKFAQKPITIAFKTGPSRTGGLAEAFRDVGAAAEAAGREAAAAFEKGAASASAGAGKSAADATAGQLKQLREELANLEAQELALGQKLLNMRHGLAGSGATRQGLADNEAVFAQIQEKLAAARSEIARLRSEPDGRRGGNDGGLGGSTEKAANGERNLAEASARSGAALAAQDTIIQKKLGTLKELEARLGAAERAETKLTAASGASRTGISSQVATRTGGKESDEVTDGRRPPLQQPGLLRTTTAYDKEGNPKSITDVYSTGVGETLTEKDGVRASATLNRLESFRAEARQIEAEFAGRGFAVVPGSAEQIALITAHAQAVGELAQKMREAKLGATDTAQALSKRGNILSTQAAEVERRAGIASQRSEVEEFKAQARKIESDFAARQSGARQGSEENIALLREQAAAHRSIAEAMAARNLGEQALAQTQLRRASDLEGRASRREEAAQKRSQSQYAGATEEMKISTLRDWQQQADRVYQSNLALAKTDFDRLQALKQQAATYREIADEAKTQGLGRTGYGRAVEGQAIRLEGAAARKEAEALLDYQKIVDQFMAKTQGWKQVRQAWEETPEGTARITSMEKEADGLRTVMRLREEYDAQGRRIFAKETGETRPKAGSEAEAKTPPPVTNDERAAAARQFLQTPSEGESGGGLVAKFGKTIGTVALWMTAYEAFFAAVHAIESGVQGMIQMEAHTAQLQSVMRGTKSEATALRDATLGLAIATGRSGEEAMDAAVRWSRLGLSQQETLAAIDLSLKSANISGMTAAQTAESFAAIYSSFGLSMAQLSGVFNQMNAMAVRFNAADKDIIAGLARVGSAAHQAGLEVGETMSLIATITGRTGRPGAEAGNAVKRLLTNLGKPDVRDQLEQQFGITPQDSSGEMKKESQFLDELYLKYISLGKAEQQELLNRIAGAQQASRIAAMLDGYSKAKALEIQALTDYNRAEIENKLRRDTMQRDLAALQVEWQRFWVAVGDSGALNSLKNVIASLERIGSLVKDHPNIGLGAAPFPLSLLFYGNKGELRQPTPERQEEIMRKRRDELEKKYGNGWEKTWFGRGVDRYFKEHGEATYTNAERQFLVKETELNQVVQHRDALSKIANWGDMLVKNFDQMKAENPEELRRHLENYASAAYPDNVSKADAFETRLRALMDAGDSQGVKALIEARSKEARGEREPVQAEAEQKNAALVAQTKADLKKIEAEIGASRTGSDDLPSEMRQHLIKTRDELHRQLDELRDPSLGKYFDNELDEDGGTTELRKRYESLLHGIMQVAEALPAMNNTAIAKLEKERSALLAQRAALEGMANEPLRKEMTHEIDQKVRQLDIQRDSARMRDAIEESVREARGQMEAFKIGRNPTEKMLNEALGIRRHLWGMGGPMLDPFPAVPVPTYLRRPRLAAPKPEAPEEPESAAPARWVLGAIRPPTALALASKERLGPGWIDGHPTDLTPAQIEALAAAKVRINPDDYRTRIGDRAVWPNLPGAAKRQFDLWKKELRPEAMERDDYDFEGFWLSAMEKRESARSEQDYADFRKTLYGDREGRHFPDTFKKPNHPTFSAESIWAKDRLAGLAGSWEGENFIGPEKFTAPDAGQRRMPSLYPTWHLMPWEQQPEMFPWREPGRYTTPGGLAKAGENIAAAMEADPRRQAEVLEYSNRLSQIGLDLRERAYKLEAEIANEKIRQNEETSKALMMAGREDQLRAALMAKFAGMGGKLTADSFQFMDEATKRAIMSYNPELAPREVLTPLRGLEDERTLNLKSQEEVESKQREAQRWLEDQQRRMNPPPSSAAPAPPQIAPPPITLNFSDQFQSMARLVASVVRQGLESQIHEMRGTFMGLVASASASSALRAGASAVG